MMLHRESISVTKSACSMRSLMKSRAKDMGAYTAVTNGQSTAKFFFDPIQSTACSHDFGRVLETSKELGSG